MSGGGSGHEPAHAGFVADGWLSAAVCGSVFASPPTAHVSAAIAYLAQAQGAHGPGILIVVKNYAGDHLNFEYAARQARAQGVRVETVLAADDAVFGTKDTDKRRGIAGCCLLYKILGAAASQGRGLDELTALAARVCLNMRTVGAALSSCALPGGPPSSSLPHGCVEIGLGIHGERGLAQVPFAGAAALTRDLIDALLNGYGEHRAATTPLARGLRALLLVNNLGATTDMELHLIASHALRHLADAGIVVVGVSCGRYMTALDMHGLSITLLVVAEDADLDFMLRTDALQKPLMNFDAPQAPLSLVPGPLTALQLAQQAAADRAGAAAPSGELATTTRFVFERLAAMESVLNALDADVGDGDLGSGVRRA
ncbi:dihydroxyacetone kinase, partial [Strigomonas culicis]